MYNASKSNNDVLKQNGASRGKRKRPREKYFKFSVGDLVRLAYTRHVFDRDYQQKWISEIFKIHERFLDQNIPIYRVKDFLNTVTCIQALFNTSELQKVEKDPDSSLWLVEKV